MLQCNSQFDEGWRKPEGIWGTVLEKCGMENTRAKRKRLYFFRHITSMKKKNPVVMLMKSHKKGCGKMRLIFLLLCPVCFPKICVSYGYSSFCLIFSKIFIMYAG